MSNATLAYDVTKTITYLQQHGWAQECFFTFDGRCCIAGAASRAIQDGERVGNLLALLRATIRSEKSKPPLRTIAEWNDAKGRTFGEVISLLERARSIALSRADA